MKMNEFRITNFRGILDSGPVSLGKDITFVVGPNNVGKTAIMEALSLQFSDEPHRSIQTLPYRGAPIAAASRVHSAFALEGAELRRILAGLSGQRSVGFGGTGDHREANRNLAMAFNSEAESLTSSWVPSCILESADAADVGSPAARP